MEEGPRVKPPGWASVPQTTDQRLQSIIHRIRAAQADCAALGAAAKKEQVSRKWNRHAETMQLLEEFLLNG